MNISLFFSVRSFAREPRRTILLLVSLTVISALISAVAVVKTNIYRQEIFEAESKWGRWHMVYAATGPDAVDQAEMSSGVAAATLGYRHLPQAIAQADMALELTLFQADKFAEFTYPLTQGRQPQAAMEIIVPDWYLRYQDIESLPAELETPNLSFTITGAYRGNSQDINFKRVQAYAVVEDNSSLLLPDLLSIDPSAQKLISQMGTTSEGCYTCFAYVRLVPGVPINKTVADLDAVPGLIKFPIIDSVLGNSNINSAPEYNLELLLAEKRSGIENPSLHNNIRFSRALPLIINVIGLLTAFAMALMSINLVVRNRLRSIGLFAAVGLEPGRIRYTVILEALFVGLIALPLGAVLGIALSKSVLASSVGVLLGEVTVPFTDIIISIGIVSTALMAAVLFPAQRAAGLSPLAAINKQAGDKKNQEVASPLLSMGVSKGRFGFSLLYAFKHSFKHMFRFIGIITVASLLLTMYIPLTSEIEKKWIIGSRRQSYQAHYQVNFFQEQESGRTLRRPGQDFFLRLAEINSIERIYYQHSINNDFFFSGGHFWVLNDSLLTEQGSRFLDLCSPLKMREQPKHLNFIFSGLSGYGAEELELAKQHLVEGSMDVKKMAAEPIILLPKYIMSIGGTNIPYTNLKVGDTITLAEATVEQRNLSIQREYTFTIGGFLDCLPLRQVTGTTSGFVGIMHLEQFYSLDINDKGVAEVYIDDKEGEYSYPELRELCDEYNFSLITHKNSFAYQEEQSEDRLLQLSLYTIFGVLGLILFFAMFSLVVSDTLSRKREFAMLSALGMENSQISIAVLTEALSTGILGSALGLAAGIAIILKSYSAGDYLSKAQMIPWKHMGIAVGLILLACLLAGLTGLGMTLKNLSVQEVKAE